MIRRQPHLGTIDVTQAEQAVTDLLDLPMTVYPTAALLRRGWQLRGNFTAYDARIRDRVRLPRGSRVEGDPRSMAAVLGGLIECRGVRAPQPPEGPLPLVQ